MSALGAENEHAEGQPGWDGSKEGSKDEAELEKEMSALNEDGSSEGHLSKTSIFNGWISEGIHPSRSL